MKFLERIALTIGIALLIFSLVCAGVVICGNYLPLNHNTSELLVEENIDEVLTTPTPTIEPTSTPAPALTPNILNKKDLLKLHQIQVGCADAYLIELDNFFIMVDGGLAESREKVLSYLENVGVDKLDIYVATHWHGDHVDNLTAILERFGDNNTIVFGPSKSPSSKFPVPNGKGNYRQMVDGDVFEFGKLTIKCMGPYKLQQEGNCNYDSLNFLVQFGETKILITGDYIHKEILESYGEELKNIDIYKMAHHGLKVSDYCGNMFVLEHINPDIIIVPAYPTHSAKKLADELNLSSQIYDNGNGNIVIYSSGKEVFVSTEK